MLQKGVWIWIRETGILNYQLKYKNKRKQFWFLVLKNAFWKRINRKTHQNIDQLISQWKVNDAAHWSTRLFIRGHF